MEFFGGGGGAMLAGFGALDPFGPEFVETSATAGAFGAPVCTDGPLFEPELEPDFPGPLDTVGATVGDDTVFVDP